MYLSYQDLIGNLPGPADRNKDMLMVLAELLILRRLTASITNRAYVNPRAFYIDSMTTELRNLDDALTGGSEEGAPEPNALHLLVALTEVTEVTDQLALEMWNLIRRFSETYLDEANASQYIVNQLGGYHGSIPIDVALTSSLITIEVSRNLGNLLAAGVVTVTLLTCFGEFVELGLADLSNQLRIFTQNQQ